MPSPAKKRKINSSGQAAPNRGLEFFFGRQKELASRREPSAEAVPHQQVDEDEKLARRLQAEWDAQAQPQDAHAVALSPSPNLPNLPESNQAEPASPKPKPPSAVTLSLQSVTSAQDVLAVSLPLDESPLSFNPSDHIPGLKSAWKTDTEGRASYTLLTRCFVLVNATSSRKKIVDTLVNCLRLVIEADPESLLPTVWLATNAIGPPFESLELGIGPSVISRALKTACGLDSASLKSMYDRLGDAGDVAFEARKRSAFTLRRPKPLTIKSVYETLVHISRSQGKGSAEAKQRLVDKLLLAARGGEESRYVVRTLCQHVSNALIMMHFIFSSTSLTALLSFASGL